MKESILQDIERLLGNGRTTAALDLVANSALGLGMSREIDRVERLRGDYELMTRYALDGFDDPARGDMLASIAGQIRDVAVSVERARKIDSAPTLYFNTLRYERMQSDSAVGALITQYRQINDRLTMAALSDNPKQASETLLKQSEAAEKRIFNLVWITYPLTVDDFSAIEGVFDDAGTPEHFKVLLVSAVLLGQLHYYDERRLMLLMNLYASGRKNDRLEVYALCALLLSMWNDRNRSMSRRMLDRFAALTELPQWNTDVKMALMQFIRTRDTDRINRKITDEVIPRMMELGPDLKKAMGDIKSLEDFSPEENPEWEEILEKSGIADRMKELQEMQEEGADVMMATFGKLKSFPFFNDLANWFLPFHTSHSAVVDVVGDTLEGGLIARTIADSPVFCNSDKYSVVLSLSQMPTAQRSMMMSQLSGYAEQIMSAQQATHPATREAIANVYVKDLYRFFKLFRRSAEFPNPFESPVNLIVHPMLAAVFDDEATLSLVGEFYFKRHYFDDAFEIFDRLSFKMPPSAQLFQKMGYCLQSRGDIEGALKFYEQSELLNDDSRWTIKRIAACHRALGNHESAATYYERLAAMTPDDLSVSLNLGHCYLALRRYKDAMAQYYKVEFLDDKSRKALRPLAWCNLLAGDYDKARRYYDAVLAIDPSPTDFVNAGHLQLVTGHYREAVERYASAIAAMNFDHGKFISTFDDDVKTLFPSGLDKVMRNIVIDSAISRASTLGTAYNSKK